MKEFIYRITDEIGIHARPAGLLVQKATLFRSEITLFCNGKKADAKKIFAVMSLGAKNGDELTVRIDGADEDIASQEMKTFLEENL